MPQRKTALTARFILTALSATLALQTAGCAKCGFFQRIGWPECRDLANVNPKANRPINTQIPPLCGAGAGNFFAHHIECNVPGAGAGAAATPGDGTATSCAAIADKSGFIIVVVPDTGGGPGPYNPPSGAGGGALQANNCDDLFTMVFQPADPTLVLQAGDIAGILAVPTNQVNISMKCTDALGCFTNWASSTQTASGNTRCLATWNPTGGATGLGAPSSTVATFVPGNAYLMCAYINYPQTTNGTQTTGVTPWLYNATSTTHDFISFTYSGNPGGGAASTPYLNNWGDY